MKIDMKIKIKNRLAYEIWKIKSKLFKKITCDQKIKLLFSKKITWTDSMLATDCWVQSSTFLSKFCSWTLDSDSKRSTMIENNNSQ